MLWLTAWARGWWLAECPAPAGYRLFDFGPGEDPDALRARGYEPWYFRGDLRVWRQKNPDPATWYGAFP